MESEEEASRMPLIFVKMKENVRSGKPAENVTSGKEIDGKC